MPITKKNQVINQLEAVKSLITEAQNAIEDGKAYTFVVHPLNLSISTIQRAVKDIDTITDNDGNISTETM